MTSCNFKTSEASTKAWMRTNGILDKFLNILDVNKFRKSNKKFSEFATNNYGTTGKLFIEEEGRAIPNRALFQEIDRKKGMNYMQEIPQDNSGYEEEDIETFSKKIEYLKERMNVEVILDSDVETSRVLGSSDPRVIGTGKPVILINPLKIFKTTAIHEFGHIFIDAFPKGLENPRLQKALEYLKSTEIWSEVEALYPDLSEDDLKKEVLATAIGRKGVEIWDEVLHPENVSYWTSFTNWVKDFLRRTFGINSMEVEALTREILDDRIKEDLLESINSRAMEERVGRFIDVTTGEMLSNETTLESLYSQIQARVSIIFEKHKPRTAEQKKKESERSIKANEKKENTAFEKITELKQLLEKYSELDKVDGIIKYAKWSNSQIFTMRERIKSIKSKSVIKPEDLLALKEYNSAFGLLDEVKTMIISLADKKKISEKKKNVFLAGLSKINEERKDVNKEILTAQREIYARIMMEKSNHHIKESEEYYGSLWEKVKPQESKESWVIRKMNENKAEIEANAHKYYLGVAEKSIKDISMMTGLFVNEKNISSSEIQVISRIADAADMERDSFMQTTAMQFKEHHDEFIEKFGNSQDTEKKYEKFFQKNSNGEFSLISKYSPDFSQEYFDLNKSFLDPDVYNEYFKNVSINGNEYTVDGVTKTILKIAGKQPKINGQFVEYNIGLNKYSIPLNDFLAKNEIKLWKAENTKKKYGPDGKYMETIPADKWLNGKYKKMTLEEKTQLSIFISYAKEADRLYGSRNSLISEVYGSEIITLPGVTKTSMERFTEGKLQSFAIDKFTDTFKIKQDEFELESVKSKEDFKKVFADVNNNERLDVPIPYRARLSEQEQSLDLHSIFLLNLEAAKNYEQKKKMEPIVNTIVDVMAERTIPDYDGLSGLMKVHGFPGLTNIQVNKSKDNMPNDVKKALDMIENRFYGLKEKNAGEILGANVQKSISSYLRLASNVSLVGNFINTAVNATSGTISNLIEAIGGETYNIKDWGKAKEKYWKDSINVIKDMGSNVETSKTNLMMNYFNVMGSAHSLNNRFSDSNKFRSLMSFQSLRVFDHAGEHMMQGQTMYAVLNSIKVLNKKGEFLNAEGKVVPTKEEAASMDEVIDFVKDFDGGIRMELKPFVEATTFTLSAKSKDEILFETRGLIKKKIIDLYGLYDEDLKSAAQREWWGKLMFFLKKWIEPAGNRRLRGMLKAGVASEDLKNVDMYYSEDMKQYQEGYYTTAVRFAIQLFKAGKDFKLELIAANFKKLNSHEKANIRRLAGEMGILSIVLLSYALIGGYDDDDDEHLAFEYALAKQIEEMTYFLNPMEAKRLISSPTAALGLVEKHLAVLSQVFSPMEEYESGINKGRNKLKVKVLKATPLVSGLFEKDIETSLNFIRNN